MMAHHGVFVTNDRKRVAMPNKTAVFVMTGDGLDRIFQNGGSQSWVLNPKNATKHDYLVTVQTRKTGQLTGATEPHGMAFLVGKITDIVPSNEINAQGRYLIRISEYARIKVPCKWRGSNPVRYLDIEDELGIDPDTLDFQPLPGPASAPPVAPVSAAEPGKGELSLDHVESTRGGDLRLTLAQAKAGLAANLGIRPDQIEIIIKV